MTSKESEPTQPTGKGDMEKPAEPEPPRPEKVGEMLRPGISAIPQTEADALKLRLYKVGDLNQLGRIFGSQVVEGFQVFLEERNLKEGDVSFVVSGKESVRISRSKRGEHLIDVVDSRNVLIESFLTIRPHDQAEVQVTDDMSRRGCAVEMLRLRDTNPVKTNEGNLVVKFYHTKTLEELRPGIDEQQAVEYGRKMADLVLNEITAGVLYNIDVPRRTENYVTATRLEKGRLPRTHLLPNLGIPEKAMLLDWGTAREIEELSAEERNTAITNHLAGIVDKMIISGLRRTPAIHALNAFQDAIREREGEVMAYMIPPGITSRLVGLFRPLKRPSDLLNGAIQHLSELPGRRNEWKRIQDDLARVRRGESITPTSEEEDMIGPYIHDLVGSGLDNEDIARAIVRDFIGKEIPGKTLAKKARGLEGLGFHYDRERRVAVVSGPEPDRRTIEEYSVHEGMSHEDMHRCMLAHDKFLSEWVVYRNPDTRTVVAKNLREMDSLSQRGLKLTPTECASLGKSMADKVAVMVDLGVHINPEEMQDNTFILGAGDDAWARFSLTCPRKPVKPYDTSGKDFKDVLLEYSTAVANLFKTNLRHGPQAWRTFTSSLPYQLTDDPEERAECTHLLSNAEESLRQDPGWNTFFNDAIRATWPKHSARAIHMDYLEHMSRQEPMLTYSPETLKRLKRLDPLVVQGMEKLHDRCLIEDPIGDVTHAHFAFEGGPNEELAAMSGQLDLLEGYIIFHLNQCERQDPRFRDRMNKSYRFPFKRGVLGELEVIPNAPQEGIFLPHQFRANIITGRTHTVGGIGFELEWNERNFSGMPAGSREELLARAELSTAWGRAQSNIVTAHPDSWRKILDNCQSIISRLDDKGRKMFLLSGVRTKPAESGITGVVKPGNPRLFDGAENEAWCQFSLYEGMPEVLDRTIDGCYPRLRDNASLLFTLQDILPAVRAREKELSRHLRREEYEKLIRDKGAKMVELAGEKPQEYIDNVQYKRNHMHYVVQMTFKLADGSKRDMIVKYFNLAQEAKVSDIVYLMGISTPIIIPCGENYGIETIQPGQRFSDLPEHVRMEKVPEIVKFVGKCAGISGCAGDAHSNNTFLNPGDMEFGRIDLEKRHIHPTIGDAVVTYEFMNLEHMFPQWLEDPLWVYKHWPYFREGLHELKSGFFEDPATRRHMGQVLDDIESDPEVTVPADELAELEGLSRVERDEMLRNRFLPGEVSEITGRIVMTADEVEGSILTAARRVEELRIVQYKQDLKPLWHLLHMEDNLGRLVDKPLPFKAAEILEGDSTREMGDAAYTLGMHARLEAALQLEGGRTVYLAGEGETMQPGQRLGEYVVARKLQSLRVFDKPKRHILPKEATMYGIDAGDIASNIGNEYALVQLIRKSPDGRKLSSTAAEHLARAITRKFMGTDNDGQTANLRDFARGAMEMDAWLKTNVEEISSNAGKLYVNQEELRARIMEDFQETLNRGIGFNHANEINIDVHLSPDKQPTDAVEVTTKPRNQEDVESGVKIVERAMK